MREFWVASGHHLAQRDAAGWLAVTDELLLAWLARPEVVPPDDACAAERTLYARLRAAPRAPVAAAEVAAIADPDARENWTLLLAFRDRLLAAGTVEAAYLGILRDRPALPPIFLGQLAQLTLRNALDGCDDPFVLRAAEIFWRPQRTWVREGALHLADLELAEALEAEVEASPLMAILGAAGVDRLDVMSPATAWTYWSRSDAHAMALPFGAEPRAREGLGRAIAAFLRHLLRLEVRVEPLARASDVDLHWYVGLDAEATAIGDALWHGRPAAMERLIGLFRLSFAPSVSVDPRVAGHPVYLLLAMTPDGVVRMKPQNLVAGLPLLAPEGVEPW